MRRNFASDRAKKRRGYSKKFNFLPERWAGQAKTSKQVDMICVIIPCALGRIMLGSAINFGVGRSDTEIFYIAVMPLKR